MNNSDQLPVEPVPPHRRKHPSKLFVETTTRCNLGCVMCVKQSGECKMIEGDLTRETFAALEPAFPHLDALILNGVGEPLLNPHLATFIRRAKQLMPAHGWIGFQTNGLLLTNLRALSLVEAGLDRICISIDASSPEMFRKLRDGGDLSDVEHALAAVASAKWQCSRPEVQVGIEFVVMRSNLRELPSALHWSAAHGASFAIVTHVLPYEEQHASEAAYDACSGAAITLFERYRSEAAGEGLDIARYFQARWKYDRSDEEKRLVAIVEAMKREAHERGLFVDMKKLLQLDTRQVDEVATVFAQAQAVAMECGIDLRLPEISLPEKRQCHFAEEGGGFVSWDGNVSPCYFLWHRYQCYASGWKQQVHHKTFGNLGDRGILEIWNDPAFRSFRKQATSYDYSGCASCSLAPCDYVQTDSFEHDCHVADVPCGACLWCMGIFQCLQ